MTPDDFKKKSYKLERYEPSTALGCFDLALEGKSGTLAVTVTAQLEFEDRPTREWEKKDKTAFEKGLGLVADYWGKKFQIRCTKKGWEKVALTPTFELKAVKSKPHFALKIVKPAPGWGAGQNVVRPDQTGLISQKAVEPLSDGKRQIDTIKEDMVIPVVIPIGDRSSQFSFQSMVLLDMFAWSAMTVFGQKLSKVPIEIVAWGGAKDKENVDNAKKIVKILEGFGLKGAKTTARSGKAEGEDAPAVGARISYDKKKFEASFPKKTEAVLELTQASIVHEFGHMLGLPDEYARLCSEGAGSLVGLGLLGSKSQAAKETQVRLKDFGKAGTQNKASQAVKKNQKAYIDLCGRAGVVAPTFGRATPNLMSTGSRFQEHILVTVWEALAEMTKADFEPSDWQIRMA